MAWISNQAVEVELLRAQMIQPEQAVFVIKCPRPVFGSALKDVNEFLGDFRTGDTIDMDAELLNILYHLRESVGSEGAYEVISG